MGRRGYGKECTDDMRRLDIRRLHRDGLLTPGRAFGWNWHRNGETVASINIRSEADRVILTYRARGNGGEWQPMEYPVYLEWTGLHFGGRMPWFLCPARGCGRRVAVLYGGRVFACRHCHQLTYRCTRETDDDRACRRADTLRDRLGWEPGILNGEGCKPKGMHWRTFERLSAAHNVYVARSLAGAMRRFKLLNGRANALSDKLDALGL